MRIWWIFDTEWRIGKQACSQNYRFCILYVFRIFNWNFDNNSALNPRNFPKLYERKIMMINFNNNDNDANWKEWGTGGLRRISANPSHTKLFYEWITKTNKNNFPSQIDFLIAPELCMIWFYFLCTNQIDKGNQMPKQQLLVFKYIWLYEMICHRSLCFENHASHLNALFNAKH